MTRKAAAWFSVLIPGLGQMLMGRPIRGSLFLLGAGLCVDVSAIAWFRLAAVPPTRSALTFGPLVLAALLWLYGIVDAFILARPEAAQVARRRDQHYRQGLLCFLVDDLEEAEAQFRQAIRLDRDDVDARFHLALTLKARGDLRKARRVLLQCRELDEEKKWRSEIGRELESLEKASSAPPERRDADGT